MKISFCDIYKEYHTPALIKALDHVSWEAESGSVIGLLGPNGAGKSTTIKLFLSILQPNSGEILVDGEPLKNAASKIRHKIGYMPEERGFYPEEDVIRQLAYLGSLKGLSYREAKNRALEMLKEFDLAEWANAKIAALSKGMTFKAQLIACLLHKPQIVILDEPFYGLDPINIRLVRHIITSLRNEGCLVILSTHMMNEVEILCDKVVMLNRGQVVVKGTIDEVRKNYEKRGILVDKEADLSKIPFIQSAHDTTAGKLLTLSEGKTLQDLLRTIVDNDIKISCVKEALTPLEEIFVDVVARRSSVN